MNRPLVWLARFALVVALCSAFVIALMPSSGSAGHMNDKLLHAMTFFGLGGLASAGFRRRSGVGIFIFLTIFGGLIEIAQWLTDWGRSAEWADLGADMAGAFVGIVMARILTRLP